MAINRPAPVLSLQTRFVIRSALKIVGSDRHSFRDQRRGTMFGSWGIFRSIFRAPKFENDTTILFFRGKWKHTFRTFFQNYQLRLVIFVLRICFLYFLYIVLPVISHTCSFVRFKTVSFLRSIILSTNEDAPADFCGTPHASGVVTIGRMPRQRVEYWSRPRKNIRPQKQLRFA